MVLTDRQRSDLHAGIHAYLLSRPGPLFAKAAEALAAADPDSCRDASSSASSSSGKNEGVPLLEKKWTAVPRLQRKVLELERAQARSAEMYAHRNDGTSAAAGGGAGGGGTRRMLPRHPCAHTLKGHMAVVTCVAVHPVFTVAVSGSEDGTIKVWDHESGEYVRTLKGHTNTVTSLTFAPTGSHLASCSSDLSIKLWDFSTHSCVRTLRGHDHTISAVRFVPSPASAISAAATTTSSAMSTAAGASTAGEATSSSTATGIDVSTSGTAYLVSASRDRTVKFWDVETGFCDHTISDHSDWVRCVAVREEDGGLVATSGNDCVIFVYKADGDRRRVCELRGHDHVVEGLAFATRPTPAAEASRGSGTGTATKKSKTSTEMTDAKEYLASCGRDRTVRLWTVSGGGSCLATFEYHENWVRSVLIHPSGNYVLSAGDDRSIRVFDVKANRCLRTIESAHPHFVTSIAMHHTLPILVSGGVDQTVKCWRLD